MIIPLAFGADVAAYIIGSLITTAVATGASLLIGVFTKPKPKNQFKDTAPNEITRGGYLPVVIGRRAPGCHVGWVGDRVSYQQGSGGKGMGGGAPSANATYYLEGACHQLCHGPIRKIYRIWCGDRLIWNQPIDFDTVADGAQFILANGGGVFRVYSGRTDQPVDTYLAEATGVASAYPGLAYVSWQRKNLGTGTSWPPFKYEFESRVDDLAAAAGLSLAWCTAPTWQDESVPAQTGVDGVTVFLNGEASIPAGSYKITYRAGAYKLDSERGWQVHSNVVNSYVTGYGVGGIPILGSFLNTHIEVVDAAGDPAVEAPGGNTEYTSQEDAELAEAGATATFTWAGGVMGIRFRSIAQFKRCVPGTPNPTYDVELVAGGPVYSASIVVRAGGLASGDSGNNPAAVLYFLLCAPFPYGCGIPAAWIDTASLAAAALTLADEGMAVNVSAEDGKQADDAVASLLSDIGMLLPQAGNKLVPYLIRPESTVPTLTDDLLQGGPPEENRQHGRYNPDRFTFQIADVLNEFATGDISADDDAQASENTRPQATTITLENVTSRVIARQIANRKQIDYGSQGQKVPSIVAMREARNPKFHPGRSFEMGGSRYRVSGWLPDTKGVSAEIEAVLDQYGDNSNESAAGGEGDTWRNEPSAPPQADLYFLPLIVLRSQWPSTTSPRFGVGRVRANHSVIAASVWISTDSSGSYQQAGTQNPASAGGTLITAFDAAPGVLATGPAITPYNDDMASVPDLTGDSASYDAGLLLVACEQELMLLESITANIDGTYTLNQITRGAFGTTVAAHAIDTPLVIIQRLQLSALFSPLLAANQGSTLWVKTQPSDGVELVDLSLVTPQPLEVPINLLATISITSPAGSLTVPIGVVYPLTWKTTELTGDLTIEFSDDDGGSWSTLATPVSDAGAWDWDTTGITATTTAKIRVSSVLTPTVQDTTYTFALAAITAPAAPTLTGTPGEEQVTLNWTAVAVVSYNVNRALVTGGPYTTIATITSTASGVVPNSYVDGGLTNDTEYFYVVTAVIDGAESIESNEVAATPFHCDCTGEGGGGGSTAPVAPLGLATDPGNEFIRITWARSIGASSYEVFRSTTTGGPYTSVGTTGSLAFINLGLTNGTEYFYVVQASNAFGTSADSAEVSSTPDTSSSYAGVDGLVMLFEADYLPLFDGDEITTFTDSTYSGNDAIEVGITAPTLQTGVVNGHAVARFDVAGEAYYLTAQTQEVGTVFVVHRYSDGATFGPDYRGLFTSLPSLTEPGLIYLIGRNSYAEWYTGESSGTWRVDGVSGATIDNLGAWHVSTFDPTATHTFDVWCIGSDREISGRAWAGDVAAVLAFDRLLSGGEIATVEAALLTKYGIS